MSIPVGPFRRVPLGGGAKVPPSNFPVTLAHLEEYYDSRTLIAQAHGSNVTSWADLSGNGRTQTTFVPDNPPTYLKTSSTSPKGTPLVRFNGIDQSLSSGSITMPNVNTRGYTFHWYGTWPGGAANGIPWQDDTGLRPQLLSRVSAGTMGWRDTANTRTISGTLTGVHLYTWVFALPNTGLVYMDGTLLGTATWTIAHNVTAATILGCNQSNNAHLAIDMGFGVWYSDTHSQATINLFRLWASVYWGF